MAGKNKGGREARKPKQDHNKRVKGQTPSPVARAVEGSRPERTAGKP
jgi:hypothetical protein